MSAPWRTTKDGLELRVRLTPKSSRDAIEGIEETADGLALKARVTAIPEDGKANAALERLIADWLHLPKRSVAVTSGPKSRIKTLTLTGDAAALSANITATLAQ
jgi:uncharacterized protein